MSRSFRLGLTVLTVLGFAVPVLASTAGEGGDASPDLTTRMTALVIQLGVVLFAARLGNMLFEKFRVPGVLGELCAGVLIGPYLLGGLPLPIHGFEDGMFAVAESVRCGSCPVSPELYGICSVAAIILLFLVGVETDLKMFVRYSVAGSLVGIGGVAVSFAAGDLIGIWLLPTIMPGQTFSVMHAACIFLGVMSTATSVSITARILSERKKLDSPEGVTTLAAAVIDDVLGIVMLAIGMGLVAAGGKGGTAGVNWAAIGIIALKAVGIWLGATVFGILVSRKVSSGLKRLGGNTEIAVAALGMALVVGGLFEEAHLAMIIGAYVMGLALSRADISHMIREKLHSVYAFMVPVFFAVMGMMVNIKMMASRSVLVFGLIYTFAAVLAKLFGCGLPALLCRFNLRGALRVGMGMVPRGEVALIVAGIGRASGLLTDEVFGVAVLMTLLTTVIAPPLLVLAYRSPLAGMAARGRGAEAGGEDAAPIVYTFANAEIVSLLLDKLFACLQQDGFFTHTMNRDEGLHQARKDDLVISIKSSPRAITFECPAHAVSIIRVLMIEVVAEYEQTLRELRKLLDDDHQLCVTPDELARLQRRERIASYLSVTSLVPQLKGRTKQEVIGELVGVLAKNGRLREHEAALADVLKREAAMSTGLGHGIACPHARTEAVDRLVCALGVSREGVDFGAVDGKPARLVLLTLCPTAASEPYMAFQAAALATLNDREMAAALLGCNTPGELFHALCARGSAVKR